MEKVYVTNETKLQNYLNSMGTMLTYHHYQFMVQQLNQCLTEVTEQKQPEGDKDGKKEVQGKK